MTKMIVKKKSLMLRAVIKASEQTYDRIGQGCSPAVSTTQVARVVNGHDQSPNVRAELIRSLGLPEDFFAGDYEMTITLTKKEEKAA